MKNTKESMKKTALFMVLEEFEELIEGLTDGEQTVKVEDGEITIDESVIKELSEYFDINITSIHADGCDITGVWIIYKNEKPKNKIGVDIQKMNEKELDNYIAFLPIAYKLLLEATGLVCGTTAEALRDELYITSKELVKKYIIGE